MSAFRMVRRMLCPHTRCPVSYTVCTTSTVLLRGCWEENQVIYSINYVIVCFSEYRCLSLLRSRLRQERRVARCECTLDASRWPERPESFDMPMFAQPPMNEDPITLALFRWNSFKKLLPGFAHQTMVAMNCLYMIDYL